MTYHEKYNGKDTKCVIGRMGAVMQGKTCLLGVYG